MTGRISIGAMLLPAFVAALLWAAAATEAAAEGRELRLKTIGQFVDPAYVATAPGRPNRKLLFVAERRGTVKLVKGGEPRSRPFLDIRKQVTDESEGGLLSIAFDREYQKNRRFYAYFSDPQGDIRVSQHRRSEGSRLRAEPTGRRVLEIRHRDSQVHYGGR